MIIYKVRLGTNIRGKLKTKWFVSLPVSLSLSLCLSASLSLALSLSRSRSQDRLGSLVASSPKNAPIDLIRETLPPTLIQVGEAELLVRAYA